MFQPPMGLAHEPKRMCLQTLPAIEPWPVCACVGQINNNACVITSFYTIFLNTAMV